MTSLMQRKLSKQSKEYDASITEAQQSTNKVTPRRKNSLDALELTNAL